MPRPPRADDAGGLYRVLHRGDLRATILHKHADFKAFERILHRSFSIQDDAHLLVVCRCVERNALRAGLVERAEEWRWGSLWRWLRRPEPNPQILSPWPLARLLSWVERVYSPLSESELAAARLSAHRGRPLGDDQWAGAIARRLSLESAMRPAGPKTNTFPGKDNQKSLTDLTPLTHSIKKA